MASRATPKVLETGGADHVTEASTAPAPSAAFLTATGPTRPSPPLVASWVAVSLKPSSCTY